MLYTKGAKKKEGVTSDNYQNNNEATDNDKYFMYLTPKISFLMTLLISVPDVEQKVTNVRDIFDMRFMKMSVEPIFNRMFVGNQVIVYHIHRLPHFIALYGKQNTVVERPLRA